MRCVALLVLHDPCERVNYRSLLQTLVTNTHVSLLAVRVTQSQRPAAGAKHRRAQRPATLCKLGMFNEAFNPGAHSPQLSTATVGQERVSQDPLVL